MLHSSPITLRGALACAACVLSVSIMPIASAQRAADSAAAREEVTVSPADNYAAAEAGPGRLHALAAHTPGAKEKLEAIHRERVKNGFKAEVEASPDATTSNALTGPFFYVGDLASGGGPTLATTRQHAIYVNATGSIASNWGNPEGFLRDLNESTFIHLADQYVGAMEDDRYPVGGRARVHYGTPGATLYEHDIAAIVHAVAQDRGVAPENLYHVFLPKGTDTCFDITKQNPTPVCYSPDNPSTFAFCGYHNAVQFTDIGIVLFTVEPWQGPGSGCEIATPTPNGVLVDSTDNVLSHETFETITDPLPGLGYTNQTGDLITGNEIGDECVLFNLNNTPGAYTPPTFAINGKNYAVQLEYSNTYHACASVP